MRVRTAVTGLVLLATACGGTQATDTSSSSSTAPPTTATTTTTTATPTTATTPPTTTTTAAPADLLAPLEIPRLENGLPATFVGVTEGWKAVEVDTATGEVLRTIGQLEEPVETEDEAGLFVALQQVWRTSDHRWYIVSSCCEPAAGMMHYLGPNAALSEENFLDVTMTQGWTAAPSPFDGRIVNLGYSAIVAPVEGDPEAEVRLDDAADASFPFGVAAWERGGRGIWWLTSGSGIATPYLVTLDLGIAEAAPVSTPLEWVAEAQWLDGLGSQPGGNLVAFLNSPADRSDSGEVETEGVVFSPEGGLVATFPVEDGSYWGGYDPSGRLLIYTDGEGTVRWQGLGQSGTLAEGFIHASW